AFKNSLLVVVILLALHLEASKIAYKKPLYGKSNFIKDKRVKTKPIKEGTTTSSTTTTTSTSTTTSTTEENWPAPVEFVIVTTPKAILENTSEWNGKNGSSTELFSTTPETGSSRNEESGEVAAPPQEEASNEVSTTLPMTTTTSSSLINTIPSPPTPESVQDNQPVPCTCGVFLSSQIQNGLPTAPLIHQELDRMFPCNAIGRKQCQTKCLEAIVQHLPNSANIVCSALGHDCHKERAYLFIKNCHNQWVNTNLQAGREYCCRGGLPYRCPLMG
ncbi:hypothetical protein KR067_002835, partial [Drosophila pandora]